MRRYETLYILHPELSEEQRQPLFDKLTGLMSADHGMLVKLDEWGNRKLAYEIKKQTRGYYVLMEFCGDGPLVKEIERNMRLDDRILKYLTVLTDKAVDAEAAKAEIETAKAETQAAKEEKSSSEPTEQGADDEKGDSESTKAGETLVNDTEASENTPETSDQEEPENGPKQNGAE
ncbi:MAG: 30S ribosomal protein S6 [Desulfobacterales bacterium C00003060]|nr:MAG: 30S ribosomal protein S6 [Desulfobacterales bacterium C00003060]